MTEFNLVVISIFLKSWVLYAVKPPISPSHKLKLSQVLIQSIAAHFSVLINYNTLLSNFCAVFSQVVAYGKLKTTKFQTFSS